MTVLFDILRGFAWCVTVISLVGAASWFIFPQEPPRLVLSAFGGLAMFFLIVIIIFSIASERN
jgi:hypothetical protein